MIFHRVYFEANGKITGFDSSDYEAEPRSPNFIIVSSDSLPWDMQKWMVDPITFQLRHMTPEERQVLNLPDTGSIKIARIMELNETDAIIAVSDRPGMNVEVWKAYRQLIRDLPNAGGAAEQLAAWPLRPSGIDAAASLKIGMG